MNSPVIIQYPYRIIINLSYPNLFYTKISKKILIKPKELLLQLTYTIQVTYYYTKIYRPYNNIAVQKSLLMIYFPLPYLNNNYIQIMVYSLGKAYLDSISHF